jgi:hypothetical protein
MHLTPTPLATEVSSLTGSEGEWIMFECNPFGAYGWLEGELGFPITATLADLLADGVI